MLRTFHIHLMAVFVLFFFATGMQTGCGGEECSRNADCQEKGKNYICKLNLSLNKRQCVKKKKPLPKCPGDCTNDTDCADCGNQTKCINLVCSTPPSQCPAECKTDDDCSKCEKNKTTCDTGVCVSKGKCEPSCTNDDDCAGCTENKTSCVNGTCDKASECPTSCTNDADCGKCESSRQKCENGTCGKPSKCLSQCKTNDDCKDCAAGNNFCNASGSCDQPPPTCKSACTSNLDCTSCPAGLNYCVGGKCSQQATSCPATCSKNEDCQKCTNGNLVCRGNTCQKPATTCPVPNVCTSDNDCVACAGRTACQNGKCAASSCPASCSNDGECQKGCGSKTKCVAGSCENPQTFCGRCGSDADCQIPGCGSKSKCAAGQCQNPNACPSFCRTDSDCSSSGCGNKRQCVSNKCINNVCPVRCTTERDCLVPACGSKTSCVSGVCSLAPASCPARCITSADCKPSACGNKTTCSLGRCTAAGQCPGKPCLTIIDCISCGLSYECRAFKCQKKLSCSQIRCTRDSQCSPCGTGYTCQAGSCKRRPTCSQIRCTRDSQCASCGAGYSCQAGSCKRKPPAGRACSTSNRCPTGYRCITLSNKKAYCFQDCTTRATTCASNTSDGRTKCTVFAKDSTGKDVSVCLGESTAGQDCGYTTNKQATCKSGQKPPIYCAKATSKCTPVVVQKKVGDPCNNSKNNTEPLRSCDGTLGLVCSEITGKCITATLAKEGEHCDATGKNLGKQTICDKINGTQMLCVSFSSSGGNNACHVECDPQKTGECSHKPGTTCFKAFSDGRGLCLDLTCTKDTDCLFPNYRCAALRSGGKACFPKPPTGPKKIGDVCGTPTNTKGCASGLECLSLQNATSGFCSKECIATCPRMGGKTASCLTVGSRKLCFVKCTSNFSCPTGLKCTPINLGGTSTRLCFP